MITWSGFRHLYLLASCCLCTLFRNSRLLDTLQRVNDTAIDRLVESRRGTPPTFVSYSQRGWHGHTKGPIHITIADYRIVGSLCRRNVWTLFQHCLLHMAVHHPADTEGRPGCPFGTRRDRLTVVLHDIRHKKDWAGVRRKPEDHDRSSPLWDGEGRRSDTLCYGFAWPGRKGGPAGYEEAVVPVLLEAELGSHWEEVEVVVCLAAAAGWTRS